MYIHITGTSTPLDIHIVLSLAKWSEGLLMRNPLSNVTSQYQTLFQLHQQIVDSGVMAARPDGNRLASLPLAQFTGAALTSDTVAMVLDVILGHSPIEPSFLLIWDGTGEGRVELRGKHTAAIQQSLHATDELSNCVDPEAMYSYAARRRISGTQSDEGKTLTLLGNARRVLFNAPQDPPLDESFVNSIKNLKSGSWIKIRNLFCGFDHDHDQVLFSRYFFSSFRRLNVFCCSRLSIVSSSVSSMQDPTLCRCVNSIEMLQVL